MSMFIKKCLFYISMTASLVAVLSCSKSGVSSGGEQVDDTTSTATAKSQDSGSNVNAITFDSCATQALRIDMNQSDSSSKQDVLGVIRELALYPELRFQAAASEPASGALLIGLARYCDTETCAVEQGWNAIQTSLMNLQGIKVSCNAVALAPAFNGNPPKQDVKQDVKQEVKQEAPKQDEPKQEAPKQQQPGVGGGNSHGD